MDAELLRGLVAAVKESREALQAFANDGMPPNYFRHMEAEAALDDALEAAELSVAQGQGFVMVPGAYVDPRGKPVLTNEGDNMTPAILARRGLRPVYELTETREPDKPIPENCRHDWATDGMGDYCRYCKKREDTYTPPAQAAEAVERVAKVMNGFGIWGRAADVAARAAIAAMQGESK